MVHIGTKAQKLIKLQEEGESFAKIRRVKEWTKYSYRINTFLIYCHILLQKYDNLHPK